MVLEALFIFLTLIFSSFFLRLVIKPASIEIKDYYREENGTLVVFVYSPPHHPLSPEGEWWAEIGGEREVIKPFSVSFSGEMVELRFIVDSLDFAKGIPRVFVLHYFQRDEHLVTPPYILR